MKAILGGLLALLSFLAFADGVPLFQTATPTAAEQALLPKLNADPSTKRVVGIVTLNVTAIDSNVVTFDVDGGSYTFTGSKVRTGVPDTTSWVGTTQDGAEVEVTRDDKAGIVEMTFITATHARYRLWRVGPQRYAVISVNQRGVNEDVTPAMLAAHKKAPTPLTGGKP